MAKKIEINENWEPVEVEDLDNLFVVIFKHGSFDQGYVEAFDTDDVLMQSAYDSLAKQYDDCGCDELTKIYLVKVPNTNQTVDMCNTGLFNGNCCDPHVIEAVRDLFNRADCEHLSCWEGCGLTEAKKKKKYPFTSATCGFTDPALNIKHFNKCMGTGGLQNPDAPHLVVGDTLPNGSAASEGTDNSAGEGSGDAGASGGEGGAVGESLGEDIEKELKIQDNENIENDINELDPPIDPEYFPNEMGINLCSVKSETWVQQDDGQLKTITVEFDPAETEELTEAGDYWENIEKMRKLNDGTRGISSTTSESQLRLKRQVCIDYKFWNALKIIEDLMISKHYLDPADRYNPKRKIEILNLHNFDTNEFLPESAKLIWNTRNDPQKLAKDYSHSITDLLIILIFALWMKEAGLADTIKNCIISNFTVSVDELKEYLNRQFTNKALVAHIKQIIHVCCTESLEEATAYSHKLEDTFEVPPQISLLNQNIVEDFVRKLSPEELFRVGYVTPVKFYSELDDKFDLVKATEMEGYTGMDYRDAVADQNVADHAERVANAQRQIDTYKDVLDPEEGHKLNPDGEKFSTRYRATNKLAINPVKSNHQIEYEYEVDELGNPKVDEKGNLIIKKDTDNRPVIKAKIEMNKILFYPRVGSQPIVHYYIDFHNGQGFKPIRREVLVDTLYTFILQVEKANAQGVSKTDLMWLQKKGYGNVKKNATGAIEAFYNANGKKIPIWAYRKAEEEGVPVEDYYKEHPYSYRWGMNDFRKKAGTWVDADASVIMAQDAQTVSGKELKHGKGMGPHVNEIHGYLDTEESKPQVRALYSNQVYWLEGNPGTLGRRILHEELEEDVKLDEAKRYVKRYYVRPLNIFCGNKEDIIQALIRAGDQNCSVYSLKNLDDHEDVHLLQPSDIIYYWDDRVLYDKNHVQVMDYDLFVKHEEERKKVGNVDTMSDVAFGDMYDDRATDADLKDKEVIANYKALNTISR